MNEDKATRYHRLKRRATIASLVWGAGLVTVLLGTDATFLLSDAARDVAASLGVPPALVPPATAAAYAIILLALHELGAAPIDFFSGFLLERRYGLSTQTAGHWLVDRLKALSIGAIVASPALALVYFSLGRWPDRWWMVVTVAFVTFAVVAARLGPVLLLPLFFGLTPLDREPLRRRLIALAERAGTHVVGAFEWRLSDRTKKANAALTGLGGTRRVLVSDTLLSGEYSDDEIEVILAHELGHHVHGDIWKGILVDAMLAGAGFFTAHQVLLVAGPVLGLRGIADPAGLPLLVASVAALSQVLLPIDNAVSRERERRADRFALSLTGNAGAFVSAMRRLGAQNLAEDNPSWVVRTLFSSHPPIRERIAAVESPTFSGRSAPPSLPGSRYRSPGYSRTESSPADRL